MNDPFCCLVGWGPECVSAALSVGNPPCGPLPALACGVYIAGDCLVAHANRYCNNLCNGQECPDCCQTVCGIDPFCCNMQWDGFCVGEAERLCGCAPEDAPPNNDCASAAVIGLGDTPFTSVCSTPDGPPHAGCNDGFVLNWSDVWFRYQAGFTGTLTVSTCGLVAVEHQMAAYSGADCLSLSDPPLACAIGAVCDPAAGSAMSFPVMLGSDYLIRIGGTYINPTLSGMLNLSDEPLDVCKIAPPPDATDEGEPCGSDTNGGCNFEPKGTNCCSDQSGQGGLGCDDPECEALVCATDPFCCDTAWDGQCADEAQDLCPKLCVTPMLGVDIGDVIHGTAWADGGTRDTDWFLLVLAQPTNVTLTIEAEFPYVAAFVEQDPPGTGTCAAVTGAFAASVTGPPDCIEASVSMALGAGNHILFAATNTFNGVPCQVQCPADTNGDGQVSVGDLSNVIVSWGGNGQGEGFDADVNNDGIVNVQDLTGVITGWGMCPPPGGVLGNDYVLTITGA
jgi:hypothetical protein